MKPDIHDGFFAVGLILAAIGLYMIEPWSPAAVFGLMMMYLAYTGGKNT